MLFRRFSLLVYALLILIPLLVVVLTSMKTLRETFSNPLGLPADGINIDNYVAIFQEQTMAGYFMNSVIVTLFSVTFTLIFASMIAFGITRLSSWLGNIMFTLFTLGMMVPAQVIMVPLYSLMLDLNLTNSLVGLILVNVSTTLPIAVFILTGFMKTLPKELFEASTIDGAGNWQMFTKVAIPLSLPSLSATAIFLFVMHWNDLLYPLLFITDNAYKTLPLALLEFQGQYSTNYPMLFTGVIIASAPMVIAYVFLQRFFVAGMTAGAVKG
ncbi:ABC transporter permease [Planococcus glaciei]|uniref:Carbohydrate ABC transporter permease n=1 Tax=Planococcus glaciei TaxID=459472 RepID=A0A7H8QAH6_9BACL|nr:carbohydrate ABC transporter permease [Planococcus glaciei]ETP70264.1 ABC transporter permease [Planococcus glaciei CHR43]KOF11015.1 ABC transporter permease [Planococcus glaciei]QDY45481.1 carbohydrate ABC transporter permease [Planococcus glaciei]QKX50562.1 carbohydrate ABC transporter permease [Planococcus glaciei]